MSQTIANDHLGFSPKAKALTTLLFRLIAITGVVGVLLSFANGL